VVNLIVVKVCLSKVKMDGDSGLNILYIDTLEKVEIPRSHPRQPSCAPWVNPSACHFSELDNFCKEPLIFEVVDFPGMFHALLGWPCFAKFMVTPNYTYLKLKMQSPNGFITISSNF